MGKLEKEMTHDPAVFMYIKSPTLVEKSNVFTMNHEPLNLLSQALKDDMYSSAECDTITNCGEITQSCKFHVKPYESAIKGTSSFYSGENRV